MSFRRSHDNVSRVGLHCVVDRYSNGHESLDEAMSNKREYETVPRGTLFGSTNCRRGLVPRPDELPETVFIFKGDHDD